MSTPRAELDAEMRDVLAQMSVVSHVPAAPWQPTGRSRSSDEPLGGTRPPGDLGEAKFARLYGPPFHASTPRHPGADSDERRREVIEIARDELKAIQGREPREQIVEDEDWLNELKRDIVRQGEGFTVKEVAVKFRCAERMVINARKDAGREPELGKRPEFEGGRRRGERGRYEAADSDAKRQRAVELDGEGLGVSQIALILGISRMQVYRYLGKRAA